jgi:alpha-N-arabinofuranosidase
MEFFRNPVLSGFYPDPSICRVDKNYYLVTSTFSYFPGIPIFHSVDLVNWKQIGHVMDRPSQLTLDGLEVSEGIFAPAIRYYKGVFYVTCTLIGGGGNFIVQSFDPAGPWSDPVWIPEITGIDPCLFFDENNKAYIVYNSIAPNGKQLYEGHRSIRMYAFNLSTLKVMGNEFILVNGGSDISTKPIWIEAPHLFKKDGFYYLIAAEGGTGFDHSEVVFRSSKVAGPYLPYQFNPILTQRTLDANRKHPITTTGHADFVETESGEWWAVFLGCRPYEGDYYNTGRETFLAPVQWKDGWPQINFGFDEIQHRYPVPHKSTKVEASRLNGNFIFRDHFENDTLSNEWMFLRTPYEGWYSLEQRKSFLALKVRPQVCSERVNPSFIGRRQQHLNGYGSVALAFSPATENEKAGLLIFQNEFHFYFLCKSIYKGKYVIQLFKSGIKSKCPMELMTENELAQTDKILKLKIEARGNTYAFYYSPDDDWKLLKDHVDAKFLSTREAGGFVGCVYALYATSINQPSANEAYFDWFEYYGDDRPAIES